MISHLALCNVVLECFSLRLMSTFNVRSMRLYRMADKDTSLLALYHIWSSSRILYLSSSIDGIDQRDFNLLHCGRDERTTGTWPKAGIDWPFETSAKNPPTRIHNGRGLLIWRDPHNRLCSEIPKSDRVNWPPA